MLMKEIDFDKAYIKYLNKMLESDKLSELRKKIILRCLYPNQESETLTEMLKDIDKI